MQSSGGECWMDYVKQISKIKYLILNILSFINLETILSIDEGFNAYTDETMEKKEVYQRWRHES